MGDSQAAPADLFFATLTRAYTDDNPRFLRRDWLAQKLGADLRHDDRRFVLLKGAPGAGKSVFMAQLARDNPRWPRYFIRRDQRGLASSVSSKAFLLHIGFQLASLYPELFVEKQLRLSVAMRLGEVAEGGEAIGAEVKRLVASPFYATVLDIEQAVGVNRGRAVALKVAEITANAHLLDSADLLNLALIDPANALLRSHAGEQIVVLIDAIDEIRYHSIADNILAFLTHCPGLPSNVRFVISSREADDAVELFCAKQAPLLATLAIGKDDPLVIDDVAKYAAKLVADPRLRPGLLGTADGVAAFEKRLVEKADGNLGYLDALARAADKAMAAPKHEEQILGALLSLKELPSDLEGLYAFFLHQIKAHVSRERVECRDAETGDAYDKDAWAALYSPLLGILAVAMEPIDADQLTWLGSIRADRVWVGAALDRLSQFLEITDDGYRFYHATVAEFLTSERARNDRANADLYQDAPTLHRRIASRYWKQYGSDWTTCQDPYGIRNLARHLFAGSDTERLQSLISRSWMLARRSHTGSSLQGFADDVSLTLRAEAAREAPRLEELVRLHVAQLLVFEDAGAYGDRYLEALVALGRGKEASVLARLRSHPEERFRGLLTVYRALSDANEKSRLLADVEAAARAIERSMRRLLALAELGALLARSGDANGSRLLGEAIELVDSLESRERRDGWLNVAKDLAGAGDPRAMEVFSRAVEASAGNAGLLYVLAKEISQPGLERAAPLVLEQAEQLSDPGRDYVLGWMLASYVDAKHFDAAEKIIAMTRGPSERISALCRLASAVKRQDPERARTLLERAAAVKVRDTTNLVRSDELARMALVFDSIDRRRADELFAKSERAANDRRAPAFNREEARTNLIDHLTVAGRHERAASLARGIKHRLLRLQLSKFLPGALIDAGRLDDARAAAESIVQYVHKDDALAAVALALIGDGRLDEVERVVGSMTESADRRAPVLGALVEALAERGDLDRAAAVAASMPRCRSTEDTLASLAIRFARRGDPRAPELVTRAGEAAAAAQTLEAVDSHDAALLAVARALARSANCRAAADVARLIEGWDTKVAAYVDIATRAKTSDPDFAQALAADTVTLLDAPASESRMQGLHDISVAMQKDLVDLNIQRALERRKKVLAEKLAAAEAEAAERVVDAHVPGTDPMLALATLASRGVWSPYSTRRPTDAGVEIVARWTEDLERAEAGRGRRVLTRALDTAGWVRQDWAHVARLAAAARE